MKRQIPPDELREARREAFLMAGIALLGHPGGPRVTTRAVCRESRLTQRYFYESFDDYDSFIVAAYRRARKIVRVNVARNVAGRTDMRQIIEGSIAGWVEVLVAQPDVVRTILRAPETEAVLKASAQRQRADVEDMIVRELHHIADPPTKSIVARPCGAPSVRFCWATWMTKFLVVQRNSTDSALHWWSIWFSSRVTAQVKTNSTDVTELGPSWRPRGLRTAHQARCHVTVGDLMARRDARHPCAPWRAGRRRSSGRL